MSAYLTFDDGPMYPNTERVLEILADFEVAATFFMVGRNVDANTELAARVVQEGHAVGTGSMLRANEVRGSVKRAEVLTAPALSFLPLNFRE